MAKTHFSGPLQIGDQVTGTEYTILDDSNNNEILSVNPVDSATNNIGLRNAATGNNPIIYNAGEADTGLTFAGSDGTNFEEIIILDTNASAVNEVTIDNAVAGSNPSMAATGDDTNIGLQLSSKGTGVVVFGSTANGSAASGSAVVNAQRGYLIVNFTATGTAGTQTIDLVNNKLTASNILQCSIQNDGLLTAGLPMIANVQSETAGSARITIVNNSHTEVAAGTARINFVIF